MKVSFIIPLYNCLPLTQAMLASLRETLPPGFDCEVIFVDDGSTDGTRGWLKNLPAPCRTILHDSNLGFAAACNHGAATAQGEYLFFLNNDLVLLPRWLEPMLAAFTRHPAAGLVGNVQLNAATGAVDHAGIFFNHKGKPEHDTALPFAHRLVPVAAYREVDALTGACFAVRRAVWQQLGGFDEGFVNGSEDVDLALRARAAGLRHYVALRSIVRHHISASAGRKLRNEQNTYRLVLKWREPIALLAARDWCRHFIATHWDQSFIYDDRLGRAAFYYVLRLLPFPPLDVLQGIRLAILQECERWATLAGPRP
jgi:GT2 family glycosyltransferase